LAREEEGRRSVHQSRPREEEGAEPKLWGFHAPYSAAAALREEEEGRRFSDRLREEEEPFEVFGPRERPSDFCGTLREEERGRRLSDLSQGGGEGTSQYTLEPKFRIKSRRHQGGRNGADAFATDPKGGGEGPRKKPYLP
jgi:hypothetical protein